MQPKTQREYRIAWEYARDLAAIRKEEVERLRAEITRHGWTLDCSRCAALIDGSDLPDAGPDAGGSMGP